MNPRFVYREAFTVAGMKCRTTMENNLIPQLWDDFMQRSDELANTIEPDNCYGICYYEEGDDAPGNKYFSYLASIEVSATQNLPVGMESRLIPAADYAVFEHHGPLDDLQKTYKAIYGDWYPTSEYKKIGDQDFELYDQRFKFGQADSVMEIWIPIEKK